MAERWATAPMSMHSCTLEEASCAQPLWRQAMTSEWSPKMEIECVPTERAATCITAGSCRPAMRYMGGIISIRPWDEVYVDASDPASSMPCSAPQAPASACISTIRTWVPKMFFMPLAAHSSTWVAMGLDGVMG